MRVAIFKMKTYYIFDVLVKEKRGLEEQWRVFHDIMSKGIGVKRVTKNRTINGKKTKGDKEAVNWASIDASFPPTWNLAVFRMSFPRSKEGESLISYFFMTAGDGLLVLDTNYRKKNLENFNAHKNS